MIQSLMHSVHPPAGKCTHPMAWGGVRLHEVPFTGVDPEIESVLAEVASGNRKK